MKVFIFPGQGSQQAGMYRLLGNMTDEVKDIFEAASDASHKDVVDLCLKQSNEVLSLTENTQIVVTAMNLAFYRLLVNRGVEPDLVMGQSLGQFSALVACGGMSFEEVFALVTERARMMTELASESGLYSILGLSEEKVRAALATLPEGLDPVEIALINSKEQIVIGGTVDALKVAEQKMKEAGAFKVVPAKLNRAFHTCYMKGMEQAFSDYLDTLHFNEPKCRIILNCAGDYGKTASDLKADMIAQCCHVVLWRDCMEKLRGVPDLDVAEVGVGRIMAGIMRNCGFKEKVSLMSDPKEFSMYVKKTTGGAK